MKILLDMGHCLSGADTGAQGNGRREEECTREIGYKVKSKLESLGHEVIICSCDSSASVRESLNHRVNVANSSGGYIFISIHLNAGGGLGVEIYTYGAEHFAEADNVLNNIVDLGFRKRGIKDGSNLAVIRGTKMKAMLVECCFIDSEDMQKYNAENFANAIVKGLVGQIANSDSTPISQPTQSIDTSVRDKVGYVTADVLNVRYTANGEIIGQLKKGDKVTLWNKEGNWYHIYSPVNGYNQAYVSCEYIKIGSSVSNNSSNNWVARLQAECNKQGFSNQKVDGIPGRNTLTGCPTLRQGARGNITKLLQERLNALGYGTNGIDGIFGGGTHNAVVDFQRKYGLSADGIVGQNTWKVLLRA